MSTDTIYGRLQLATNNFLAGMKEETGSDGPVIKSMRMMLPGMLRRMSDVDQNILQAYCLGLSETLLWVANGDNGANQPEEVGERLSSGPVGVREVDSSGEADSTVREGVSEKPNPDSGLETPIHPGIPDERDASEVPVPKVGSRRSRRKLNVASVGAGSGSTTEVSVETRPDSGVPDGESR